MDLSLIVDFPEPTEEKGLIFIQHGLTGYKEQPHIRRIAEVFNRKGFVAVRFDATNSLGESGSDKEGFRFSRHYSDLEDVINWAKTQNWYKEPFALAGHSFGGMAAAYYAENHPEKVSLLIPISPVISGKACQAQMEKEMPRDALENWRKTGWYPKKSSTKEDVVLQVPYAYIDEVLAYDLTKNADKITAKTVLINGDSDTSCPLEIARIFYDKLKCDKRLVVLKNTGHNVHRDPQSFADFTTALEEITV